ncbi:MAG: PTS sugar transporter subunit IIA [Balneolaceae bacterium]
MDIHSLLEKSTILANVEVDSKKELINTLVDLLNTKVDDKALENIRESVFERESIMSTGVGKQLAIPHGKCSSVDENLASFAILKEPIEFDAIDNEPVKMVFLLVGPESKNNVHIKLLSRISRLMNSGSFREKLLECNDSKEIYDAFQSEEVEYFGA